MFTIRKSFGTLSGVIFGLSLTLSAAQVRADELSSVSAEPNHRPFSGVTEWQGVSSGHGHFPLLNWPPNYWSISTWNGYSYASYLNRQFYYPSFGTISYSASKDIFGGSWGQQSRHAAERVSDFYCGEFDCRPVVWVQGGCAAVVTSKSFGRVAWGTALNDQSAWYTAEQACMKPNTAGDVPSDCIRRHWVCSY